MSLTFSLQKNVYSKFNIMLILKVIPVNIQNLLPTGLQLYDSLVVYNLWVPVAGLPHLRSISPEDGCPGNWRGDNLLAQSPWSEANGSVSLAKSPSDIPSYWRHMMFGIVMKKQYTFAIKQCWLLLHKCLLRTFHLLWVHVRSDGLICW